MRKLQLQMESLAADRDSDLTQLSAVMKKGVADGVAAGVKQISTNAANSRYDLIGNGPATGLSQDPLNQIEGTEATCPGEASRRAPVHDAQGRPSRS